MPLSDDKQPLKTKTDYLGKGNLVVLGFVDLFCLKTFIRRFVIEKSPGSLAISQGLHMDILLHAASES